MDGTSGPGPGRSPLVPEAVPPCLPEPLSLPLGYPVFVGRALLDATGALIATHAANHRYAIIADAAVLARQASRVAAGLPADRTLTLAVPSGEASKSRAEWARLGDALLAWGAGRDTTVVAVGGGVVGDLAGFVAATLHRGVPVVQVPTSLLAMVDASVGGKVGLDTPAGKNLVGAFHDPSLVVADVDALLTLPQPARRDGLAEMIKHGLIADAEHFSALCGVLPALAGGAGAEVPTLPALVAHSIGIKAAVVEADAREGGRRQVLNAGHTIAHAIEHALAYAVPHGAAVAAGLVVEARLAELLGVAEEGLGDMVAGAVRRAGLPDAPPGSIRDEALLAATRGDKKARGGRVEYALPVAVGRMDPGPAGRWSRPVADEHVLAALNAARRHSAGLDFPRSG
jgi:3-dehydroquinate synthase